MIVTGLGLNCLLFAFGFPYTCWEMMTLDEACTEHKTSSGILTIN